jgi:serine/threonine protein kinase
VCRESAEILAAFSHQFLLFEIPKKHFFTYTILTKSYCCNAAERYQFISFLNAYQHFSLFFFSGISVFCCWLFFLLFLLPPNNQKKKSPKLFFSLPLLLPSRRFFLIFFFGFGVFFVCEMPVPLSIPVIPGIIGPYDSASPTTFFKYVIVQELSRVTGSLVLRVQRVSDGVFFVAKMIFFDQGNHHHQNNSNGAGGGGGSSVDLQRVEREIRCLNRAQHFACVALVDSFIVEEEKMVLLILELCTAGSLADQIDHMRMSQTRFNERDIYTWFLFLVLGLHHIHQQNMLHRDLKPPNILLHTNGLIKISDFGLSNVYEETVTSSNVGQTICGTPNYLAPELWERKQYSAKADLYSLGVVLYELVEFTTPFASESIAELHQRVLSGVPRPMTGLGSGPSSIHLHDWIMKLLAKVPEQRPTTIELLCSPLLLQHCLHLLGVFYENEAVFGPLQTHGVVKELIRSLRETYEHLCASPSAAAAASAAPSLSGGTVLPPLGPNNATGGGGGTGGAFVPSDFFKLAFTYIAEHFEVDPSISLEGPVEKFKQGEGGGGIFEKRYMVLKDGQLTVRRSAKSGLSSAAGVSHGSSASSTSVTTTHGAVSSSNDNSSVSTGGGGGAAAAASSNANSSSNNNSRSSGGGGGGGKPLPLSLIVHAELFGVPSSPPAASPQQQQESEQQQQQALQQSRLFCFLTEDGVSTFFQAETPQQAFDWVCAIQKAKRKRGFV